METVAFRMMLNPGQAAEYKRRHDEIWPELSNLLTKSGISDYSIWLDDETGHLFAVLKRRTDHTADGLASNAIVRRWWDYMADIMVTKPDHEPVQLPLHKMFHLP